MNALPRLVLCALTAAVLFLGISSALGPGWGEAGVAATLHCFVDEFQRGEDLDARKVVSCRCVRGKLAVTRQVIAGRLTLREAVEEFRRLCRARDHGMDQLLIAFRAHSEDEALCRSVISWASSQTRDPQRRAALVAHLKAEMREMLPHPDTPSR